MAGRPRKQEQEPATDEVVEVAPGVLRAQLPIDLPGLGHVNCYVIEDERGVALVDPGLPGPASFKALAARLRTIGVPLRRVHTVVVTHSHPDHYGGAG
jgi:glyoxylase-like metal-dependent hydrolase (beta-lactamase superfamily II)